MVYFNKELRYNILVQGVLYSPLYNIYQRRFLLVAGAAFNQIFVALFWYMTYNILNKTADKEG